MRILVGVCGGVAAYKAAELVRLLQRHEIEVEVAMTSAAERFVTPLTFASLSRHPVFTSLWQQSVSGSTGDYEMEHIALAQRIQALILAPATANILAKLAHGIADDFLTTVCLATRAPLLIAPAMNVNMWQHAATQANIRALEERGAHIIPPDEGYLACGMTGDGRLAPVDMIVKQVLSVLTTSDDLTDETILITAGGTREPIDPVRFLGNRSSGKMGHALAEEALSRGARVILITASPLPAPSGCSLVRVATAAEMAEAVFDHLDLATMVIKAAAVADYRARETAPSKIKRAGPITLALEPTEDIVAKVVEERKPGTLVIAFAAETDDLEANARAKLFRKGVDAIVANDVSTAGIGFECDQNAGLFLSPERTAYLPESSKRTMARRILDEVLTLRNHMQRKDTLSFAGVERALD